LRGKAFNTARGEAFSPRATGLCLKTALVFLLFLCTGNGNRLRMKRVAQIPYGPYSNLGSLICADTDHDGHGEIIYRSGHGADPPRWEILEYRPFNRYELVKSDTGVYPHPPGRIVTGNFCPFDAGDVDNDGKADLVGQVYYKDSSGTRCRAVCTIESPDSCSFPDTLNWHYTFSQAGTGYGSTVYADLDRDAKREIVMAREATWIFENVADDQESVVFRNPPSNVGPYAIADFDLNGKTDYGCYFTGKVRVCECIGDDQYAEVCSLYNGLCNAFSIFAGDDADQNGRPEFFVVYASYGDFWRLDLYMFEASGEHDYTCYPIDSDGIGLNAEPTQHRSLCADLDGDGIEEVVWSCCSHVHILKATAPHEFERVFWWGNDHGEEKVSMCNARDMNGNGYNEVLIGGWGKVSVLEVEAIKVLYPDTNRFLESGDTCWIQWRIFEPPRCDSVSLFLKTDTTVPPGQSFWDLDTIVTGLPPTDSVYPWIVPAAPQNSCRVMAIAYGPGWQYDESDSPFQILPGAITESPVFHIRDWSLSVAPDPALGRMTICYDVACAGPVELTAYDRTGRKVAMLASGDFAPGRYQLNWYCVDKHGRRLPTGIYFLHLNTTDRAITSKVVVKYKSWRNKLLDNGRFLHKNKGR